MNAEHGGCGGNFFTGLDPPRSLTPVTTPVTIPVSTTTSKDPETTIATAVPSPSPQTGARNTATDRASTRVPPHTPTLEQAKETHSTLLELKQEIPDPHSHLNGPMFVGPQINPSTLPGLAPQETSSDFRQESSISDKYTPNSAQNNPKVSVQTIASIDPAPRSTVLRQESDSSNKVSIVMGPEPNPPFAHLPATAPATNETPQDPSATKQDQRPNMPQLVGADSPNTLRTAVDSVPTVDHATDQYHVDPPSNPSIASQPAQGGDPAIFVAGVQIGPASSVSNNAVGGNDVPIQASALVATTFPQISKSSILENNRFTSPISSIETPESKKYSTTSQATKAAAISAVDVVKTALFSLFDNTAIDETPVTIATPGNLPIAPNPGAPELIDRTSASEALKTNTYDTGDDSAVRLPTGKLGSGSTSTSHDSILDSPTGKVGSPSTGHDSTLDPPTGKVGSTGTGHDSALDPPTGKVGSTGTGHDSTLDPPTGKVGSTSTGNDSDLDPPTSKAGITSTDDHSAFHSPKGKAGSTSNGDHSNINSPTSKVGSSTTTGAHSTLESPISKADSSTSTGDHSNVDAPTGKTGTTTGDYSAIGSPTGNLGSTSTGTKILESTYGTGERPASDPPTGKVDSTSTGKQVLEGRARSWKRCVDWKKVGLTGLLIGIILLFC